MPEPAVDLPDLPQPEIWVEDEDETRYKWEISPKPEPVYMPEAGKLYIKNVISAQLAWLSG